MKIYDISQELFTCVVYPGDKAPEAEAVARIADGAVCNVTNVSMCAHNGTHIDAPFHFLADGKTVDEVPLQKTVGLCYVASHSGYMTAEDAARILSEAAVAHPAAASRILLRGELTVAIEAAEVFAAAGVDLIGVESQSVGAIDSPMAVHIVLLIREIVLLEGLRLGEVPDGVYFLSAAPLNLGGLDGAPCRAILLGMNDEG